MRVLVTGATGQVGRRFVPRLARQGDAVRVLVRDAARVEHLDALGVEVLVGDLRDGGALDKALSGIDAVVHLAAAFRNVPDEEAAAVNHTATVELGRAALDAGVERFVEASTMLVYGPGRQRPARETDEPAPPDLAYPRSKAAAEQELLALHRDEGMDVRIARLAFVYGEGDPHLAQSLLWVGHWPLHQRLHMVHHADVGQALIRILLTPGCAGRIFNVADDAPVTALELHDLNGAQPADDAADRPLDDPWAGIVDTSRIRRELGFRPIYPTVYTAWDAGAL